MRQKRYKQNSNVDRNYNLKVGSNNNRHTTGNTNLYRCIGVHNSYSTTASNQYNTTFDNNKTYVDQTNTLNIIQVQCGTNNKEAYEKLIDSSNIKDVYEPQIKKKNIKYLGLKSYDKYKTTHENQHNNNRWNDTNK